MEQSKPVKPRRSKRRATSPGRVVVDSFGPSLGRADNSSGRPDSWERDIVAQIFEAAEGGSDETSRVVSETELTVLGGAEVPRSMLRQDTELACEVGRRSPYETAGMPSTCTGGERESRYKAMLRVVATEAVDQVLGTMQLAASAPLLEQAAESLPLEGLSLGSECDRDDNIPANYCNKELDQNVEFAESFVNTEVADKSGSSFYQLFLRYERCSNQVLVTDEELTSLMKHADELRNHIWYLETSVQRETGECQDGNPVAAMETSEVAHFSGASHSDLEKTLSRFRDDLWLRRVQESLAEQKTREEIVAALQEVSSRIRDAFPLVADAPPALLDPKRERPPVGGLVGQISVMFHFLRRRECRNAGYQDSLAQWLTDSVALLVRCATWQDHLYVLHHVLRCPPGMPPWLVALVQVPWSGQGRVQKACLDHAVAALGVILMPIQRRQTFLPQLVECESWVVLDVDGDGVNNIDITEEDLIKLLNQIPHKLIFQDMLKVNSEENGKCWVNIPAWRHSDVLHVCTFSSYLVELFRLGLETYSGERYKQFAKRLACLISITVSHVADLWEILKCKPCYETAGPQYQQVRHAFGSLVERAVLAIYSSQGLGIWQVLAQLPYRLVAKRTLWRLFYVLHQPYKADAADAMPATEEWEREVATWQGLLLGTLDELIASVPQDEAFYLLSVLALLGTEGVKKGDLCLGQATLHNIFQIGFVSRANRDNCSKACRTLIADMTTTCPPLLSEVLRLVCQHMACMEDTWRYLYSVLPLGLWVPLPGDVSLLTAWLADRHLLTAESACARYVLARLNYASAMTSRGMHVAIALGVVAATMKFCPETVPYGQAASYAPPRVANYVRNEKNESVFTKWAWDLLVCMRLHLMDRDQDTRLRVIYEPANDFMLLFDVHADPSLAVLSQGILGGQSIACFATLLISIWGHFPPLIASKGLELLEILIKRRKCIPALMYIQHMVPLYLQTPAELIQCNMFSYVLIQIIHADKGNSGLAANILGSGDFPGPILNFLAGVIRLHLKRHQAYGLEHEAPLAALWVNVLLQVPNWAGDQSVIFLLDVLAMHAFANGRTLEAVKACLRNQYLSMGSKPGGGAINSIISWMGSRSYTGSLLQKSANVHSTWYAALALSVEEDAQGGIWAAMGPRVDQYQNLTHPALDKLIKECGGCDLNANELAIYRWSNLVLEVGLDHPLLIFIWDRFFSLFLGRIQMPDNVDLVNRRSVGRLFFGNEGTVLGQMHGRLLAARDHFDELALEQPSSTPETEDLQRARWARSTFATFLFWIKEPKLHDAPLLLNELPSVVNGPRLMALLEGRKTLPWEFLRVQELMDSHGRGIAMWLQACQRASDGEKMQPQPTKLPAVSCDSLMERFKFYDSPVPAPLVNPALLQMQPVADALAKLKRFASAPALQNVPPEVADNNICYRVAIQQDNLQHLLRQAIGVLVAEAKLHIERSGNFRQLDSAFLTELTTLYENVSRERIKIATCSSSPPSPGGLFSRPPHVTCAGGATLSLSVTEAVLNHTTQLSLEANRTDYHLLVKHSWEPAPQALPLAVREVEQIVEYVVCMHLGGPTSSSQQLGAELFYQLYSMYVGDLLLYMPTRIILQARLQQLAGVFLATDGFQCRRLLNALLAEDRLVEELSVCLLPCNAPSYLFVEMYYQLALGVTPARATPERLVSYATILGKFNLQGWLDNLPALAQRTKLVGCLFVALRRIGPAPSVDLRQIETVYGNHLTLMLRYHFPEHFGEILRNLLDMSRDCAANVGTWYLFLNSVLCGTWKITDQLTVQEISEGLRTFATNQTHLSFSLLIGTARLVTDYFREERKKVGLESGLFRRYHDYVLPLTALLGLIGHCTTVSSPQHHQGHLSKDLCLDLYQAVDCVYSPWIAPLFREGTVPPTIVRLVPVELVDELSVFLPPWDAEYEPDAAQMVQMFTENLRIILDTLPGCGLVLSRVWVAYVTQYVRPKAYMEHTLSVMHKNLRLLPWHKMSPNLADMELMSEVLSMYSPSAHVFLGAVFLEVQWGPWIQIAVASWDLASVTRSVCIYLKLVVHLCGEPSVRQKAKSNAVVLNGIRFPWYFVDAQVFQEVLDWWVLSCDVRVVLDLGEPYTNPLDTQVFKLLRIAAPFDPSVQCFHPTTHLKRQHFLKCCFKLIFLAASKHKQQYAAQEKSYMAFVARSLDWVETATTPRDGGAVDSASVDAAALLLNEAMLVTTSSHPQLAGVVVDGCLNWLRRHDHSHTVVHAMVKLVPRLPAPAVVGTLLEAALASYFTVPADKAHTVSWSKVTALASPLAALTEHHALFVGNGQVLVLHLLLLQELDALGPTGNEEQAADLLVHTTEVINKVKPTEAIEHKLPLLWGIALHLMQRLLPRKRVPVEHSLNSLTLLLQQMAEDKTTTSWGFLQALRIKKYFSISEKFRVVCRALEVFILAQLPEGGVPVRAIRTRPHAAGSIDQVTCMATPECPHPLYASSAASKSLTALEQLANHRGYSTMREGILVALDVINDNGQSLHSVCYALRVMTNALLKDTSAPIIDDYPFSV